MRWSGIRLTAQTMMVGVAVSALAAAFCPATELSHEPYPAQAEKNPPHEGRSFDVLVVEKGTGKPIPGATIRYYTDPGELRFTTGSNGHAILPRPQDADYSITLDAWSDEHQQKRFWYNAKGSNPQRGPLPDAVKWELEKGELTVSGRAVGEDGQPVPDVEVEVQGMRAGESALAFFGIATKTDAHGRWSRRNMPKNLSDLSGFLRHPAYEESYLSADGQRNLVAEATAGTLVSKIYRGVPVRGQVLDDQGRPIQGAVLARPNRAGLGLSSRPKAITDAQGRFEFPAAMRSGRGPGNGADFHTVSVTARGYQPALKTLDFPKGSTNPIELEFRLPPGKIIRGRAFGHSGKPVANAWVIIDEWKGFGWDSNVELLYLTDSEGRFAFDAATEVPFKIRVSKRGFQDATMTVSPADGALIWKLEGSLVVELRVKDAITGAEVKRFEIERGRIDSDGQVAWTEGDPMPVVGIPTLRHVHLFGRGQATLPTDAPGWKLRVVAHGYKPFETREIKNDEGWIRLDLKLARLACGEGGGPTGVVVDKNGKPLAGVEVMLSTTSQLASLNGDSWWYGQGTLAWSGAGTVTTDEQGRFTFLPVNERFLLGAVHPVFGYGEIEDTDFQRSKKLIVQSWGLVEGTMQLGGQPLPATEIMMMEIRQRAGQPWIGKSQQAKTDGAGHFRFEKVPPGKKQLSRVVGNTFVGTSHADVLPGATTKVTLTGTATP